MTDHTFNPNDPGVGNGNYFGMPFTPDESQLVLISVPWEVTTSYGGGTALGPDAMIDASLQVDLYDIHSPGAWEKGIGSAEIDESIILRSRKFREEARKVIVHLESGGSIDEEYVKRKLKKINEASEELNADVYTQTAYWLDKGKKVGIVGGDHSVPFGAVKAIAEKQDSFGILHIDAHADLRNTYEGFTYSHASIMYNILDQIPQVSALVQVGVRDFCDEEAALAQTDKRIVLHHDYDLNAQKFSGVTWNAICTSIISTLPQKVYVSFDIDGLSPDNCPNTGTPVPGGLSYHEAIYLLWKTIESGREIIGFDLCEVAPNETTQWDANVGARVLYKLCNFALHHTK